MHRFLVAGALAFAAALGLPAAPIGSDELQDLIEAERSFARAAAEQGIREAFLAFFAPDSVMLAPQPQPAVPLWRQRPSRPPSQAELVWEPRAGDVAASGELGWLTGPSTYVDHQTGSGPRYGNYLSIWRRRDNGPWQVYLDMGTQLPKPATFDEGFSHVSLPSRYARGGAGAADGISLSEADAAMNSAIAFDGIAKAYAKVVARDRSRLHRHGSMPQVGRGAIVTFLERNNARWSFKTAATGAARSGDLGYSFGSYAIGKYRGGYVRIWARDADGRWWLMADAATSE